MPTSSHMQVLLFLYLPLALVWTAGGIALKNYNQASSNQRILAWLVWFDLISESTSLTYYYLNLPNLFLIPIVVVIEAALLSVLFGQALESVTIQRGLIWIVGSLVVYALISRWLATEKINYWPSLQLLCGLLELSLASLYFRKLMNDLQVERLDRDPVFIVSVGLMLYVLGDLLITLFSNYTVKNFSTEINKILWRIHLALNIMLYSCYCIALWIRPPKPSS